MGYWTGLGRCILDLQESTTQYKYYERQEWTLNGLPPTPFGGQMIYDATWMSTGFGNKTEPNTMMPTNLLSWKIEATAAVQLNIIPLPAPPSDNWEVEQWSSQVSPDKTFELTQKYFNGNQWKEEKSYQEDFEFNTGKLESVGTTLSFQIPRSKTQISRHAIFATKSELS
jgi:hypothetical protein